MVTAEASPGIHNVTSSGTLVTMATAEALPDIHNVTSINNNGPVAENGTDLHRISTIRAPAATARGPSSPSSGPVMTTAATMTDPPRTGWTPPASDDGDDAADITPPPPPTDDITTSLPPRQQRTSRASGIITSAATGTSQTTSPHSSQQPLQPERAAAPAMGDDFSLEDLIEAEINSQREAAAAASPLSQASNSSQVSRRAPLRPRLMPLHRRMQASTQRRLTFTTRGRPPGPAAASAISGSREPTPAQGHCELQKAI
ncbi:PREDICTED: mucin-7-like [Cyprinodon variegatus]|uniref:mucin-7-like n=1 Tax=Cyprinodon variegatus TaxID=28743 RepID=UPI00074278A7|nr:PREDICTED: mucin-7-like [Cyprinodon variegatus]